MNSLGSRQPIQVFSHAGTTARRRTGRASKESWEAIAKYKSKKQDVFTEIAGSVSSGVSSNDLDMHLAPQHANIEPLFFVDATGDITKSVLDQGATPIHQIEGTQSTDCGASSSC